MTPPKLTLEQIKEIVQASSRGAAIRRDGTTSERICNAIADLRDQQWQEMLAGQEPMAWIPDDALAELAPPMLRLLGVPLITYGADNHTPLYTHPAPDLRPVVQQALEFVEANHAGGPDAFALIAALKQALGDQP